jgi:hypothetical protein
VNCRKLGTLDGEKNHTATEKMQGNTSMTKRLKTGQNHEDLANPILPLSGIVVKKEPEEIKTEVDDSIHHFLGLQKEIFSQNYFVAASVEKSTEIPSNGYLWEKAIEISSFLFDKVFIYVKN